MTEAVIYSAHEKHEKFYFKNMNKMYHVEDIDIDER